MWCPNATLAVWANAWLAGVASPDDVLDELSLWAPSHSVLAYDAVAAGRTGLPWPDVDDGGVTTLLQTLRRASGPRPLPGPTMHLSLPVPGDARGIPAGTQFARDAMAAGEALVIADHRGRDGAIGVVGEIRLYDDLDGDVHRIGPDGPGGPDAPAGRHGRHSPEAVAESEVTGWSEADIAGLAWTVYSVPMAPVADPGDLGEAEYTLRSAVRAATETLGALRESVGGGATVPGTPDGGDPRRLVEQLLEPGRHHRLPDHAPSRAVRVLETAAHVDAIVTVSEGLMPIGTHARFDPHTEALRPLPGMVRSARLAAVSAILASAWR